MIIEKILNTLEKYVFLDIILMLLGLINSSEGMRGYPFAWFAGESSDPGRFLMSLACVTLVVIAGDIITKLVIGLSEPVSNVQRTLDKYVSTYTEYEDPLISEVRKNAAKSTGRRSGSYENKISEDYARIRSFLNEQSKGKEESSNNNTITVKNLLNGNKAELRNIRKKKSSSSIVWWIFFIIIAILLMYW
ncbi:MAG: hypothetical protein IKE85_09400 [Mogibacterium sp.]|nr:hypothetical protein [Mogibacterium sp.]